MKAKKFYLLIPLILFLLNTPIYAEEPAKSINDTELQEMKSALKKLEDKFHELDKELTRQETENEGNQKRLEDQINELPGKTFIYAALVGVVGFFVLIFAFWGSSIKKISEEAKENSEKTKKYSAETEKALKESEKTLKESKRVLKEIKKIRKKTLEESSTIHSLAKKADELNNQNIDRDKEIKEIKENLSVYRLESDELAGIKKDISSLEETQKEAVSKIESRINDLSKIGKLAKKVDQKLSASHYFNLGYDLYEIGKYEEAVDPLSIAIELKSNYALAYNNRGVVYVKLARSGEALSDYNKAIELKPDYVSVYMNRGLLYMKLARDDEALSDYNKAIELKPDYESAYMNRGVLYVKLARDDEALSDYNKAIELKPDYALAYNNRGILYNKLNRHDEALSDYNKTIELKPDDVGSYLNLGELFICTLKFDEAAKFLIESKKVFSTVKDKIISLYLLQLALAGDGKNVDEFTNEYKAILKKNPDFKLKGWSFDDMDNFLKKQEKEDKIPAERLEKMKEIHEEFKKLA